MRYRKILDSIKRLNDQTNKRKIATLERIWIQRNVHINRLNYWYYRRFTNEFELFLLTYYHKEFSKI